MSPKYVSIVRTPSPVTMPDIDGCHARDLIAPLFFNDNTELHNLIRDVLSFLTYLALSIHLSLKNMQVDF